ncbi:hypothetical protein NX059_005586 [Plenodomus lindquistii]|nr:hypothetical protein NX059_005586 [Plenodomus lindquistii]
MHTSCENGSLPHYLSREFVGNSTVIEVVQSLYRKIGSFSLMVCHTNWLKDILARDPFHVGITTAEALRNIAYVDAEALRNDFSALNCIAKKPDFKLHLQLVQRNLRLRVFKEVMDVLYDVIDEFVEHGASVTASWAYRGNWKPWKCPHYMNRSIWEITHIFDMSFPGDQVEMQRCYDQNSVDFLPRHTKKEVELPEYEVWEDGTTMVYRGLRPRAETEDYFEDDFATFPPQFSAPWVNDMVHGMCPDDENEFTTDDEADPYDEDEESDSSDDEGSQESERDKSHDKPKPRKERTSRLKKGRVMWGKR